MTIEFRCTQCEKLLRTPDGTGGKTAKCPQCGAMLTIPGGTGTSEGIDELLSSPAQQPYALPPQPTSQNPYQSPTAPEMQPGPVHDGTIRRGFNPTKIDLGDVMNSAWLIFKANMWPCIGVFLLVVIVPYFLNQLVSVLFGFILQDMDDVIKVIVMVTLYIVSIAFNVFLQVGFTTYMLKVARGEEYSVADVFSGAALIWPAWALGIIVGVAAIVGFLFLIVPGIIVLLMFAPWQAVLIDQKTSIFDTLRYTARATNGNKLTILLLFLVYLGLGLLGVLALCIGLLFVVPFAKIMSLVAYLKMTGQSTADEAYATL